MITRGMFVGLALLALLVLAPGCRGLVKPAAATGADESAVTTANLRATVAKLEAEIATLKSDAGHSDSVISGLRRQVDSLQSELTRTQELRKEAGDEFTVDRLELGRLTSCANWDEHDGDDGVLAFVYPTDKFGDAVKRAGAFEITVTDIGPQSDEVVAHVTVPAADAQKYWRTFPSAGYQFRVPWSQGPPLHKKVRIKVVMWDLAGKDFVATRELKYDAPQAD